MPGDFFDLISIFIQQALYFVLSLAAVKVLGYNMNVELPLLITVVFGNSTQESNEMKRICDLKRHLRLSPQSCLSSHDKGQEL